ncbi:hypothetical protein COU78_06035 [Candidatus Peregrinibacteria bacterium CG10_big_fil_rev_8_21_14_0_10_49_24]|nr:MAG: hypothetical protein COV83_02870 [Candidatus Peregrinibacteria bacterium CG11_big_fil_rev_8_21_14_0_20_49_14]PIR50415.1 MAG: hypothetical protein COU78_06035 [Candidatus Peregrinibacteria bacterium CG10_big_fil_rev_8_21_14_0_10_49_24]PJA68251.1 MAG: hypothetical protein CO157_00025 [Candidatus Peregrinibacteria bacterium CG_4_9_14_3_um_filter_49_12]
MLEQPDASDVIEIRARMPAGAMLQANEEFRERTGQLLFGVSMGPQEDYVWGRIRSEHVQAVCDAIELHGGSVTNRPATLAFPGNTSPQEEQIRQAA